jgi:hypothetical protein
MHFHILPDDFGRLTLRETMVFDAAIEEMKKQG